MWLSKLKALTGFFFLTVSLSVPGWAAVPGVPGTVNYVEGKAAIGSQALNSKSIGWAQLQPGQSITTENGMVEVLLTPGVFLRLGHDSSAKMISPALANTEVELTKGHAMVEADQIHKANDIRIVEGNASTRLAKTGLYDFDIDQGQVRVFKGEATVREDDRQVKVKGGHEVYLETSGKLKAKKFDKENYQGGLYSFSSLRSDYLAEANQQAAQIYVTNGWLWGGPGWWWNPWFGGYDFFPTAGVFYSPFGLGFYSPLAYGAPYAVPYWGWRGGYSGVPINTPRPFPRDVRPPAGVSGPRFGAAPMAGSGFAHGPGGFAHGPGAGGFHGVMR